MPPNTSKPIALSLQAILCSGGAASDALALTKTNRHFSIYSTLVQEVLATYLPSKLKPAEDEGAITSTVQPPQDPQQTPQSLKSHFIALQPPKSCWRSCRG